MNDQPKSSLYILLGILTAALVTVIVALSSYSVVAYKNSMDNRERISVLESTQRIMLDKINEIGQDVKKLLASGR